MQTRNFNYNLFRITKDMPCMCAGISGQQIFINIPLFTFSYIRCCLLNILRLAPDPALIYVTLSWPRFLTLSRTSDAMQVNLLVCLSLLSGIYVSAGIETHYRKTPKHCDGQNM